MLEYFFVALIGFICFCAWILRFVFYYNYGWLIRRADSKKIDMIPGPKPIPIFGNIFLLSVAEEEFLKVLCRLQKEFAPIFRMWIMGFPEVILTDPDDVEVILSSPTHIKKSADYKLIEPWLGTGLLISEGDKWHTHRKILTPAFHFKILEEYIKVFNSNSNILVQKLTSYIKESYVDITTHITMCTLDIICETAMGISIHAQEGYDSEYTKAVKRISKVIVQRQFSPWLYRDMIYYLTPLGREQVQLTKTLHKFTDKVIMERREEYKSTTRGEVNNIPRKRRRLAFLDLLIEVSEKEGLLTDADIREEVDTFMFEGHDTTSMGISWALYLLGLDQDVQDKVVEELKVIFGDSDREATHEDLQKMKYLEQVIKETLRLFPSVPAFSRILDVEVKLKNYTLPAGTQTPIVPYLIHRNPKVFPNPEQFNPDNFLPEKNVGRHPFAYIPFSAGPRNCIGQRFAMMEEKIVLSSILRKLKVESLDRREDLPVLMQLILRPKNGLRIKILPR